MATPLEATVRAFLDNAYAPLTDTLPSFDAEVANRAVAERLPGILSVLRETVEEDDSPDAEMIQKARWEADRRALGAFASEEPLPEVMRFGAEFAVRHLEAKLGSQSPPDIGGLISRLEDSDIHTGPSNS